MSFNKKKFLEAILDMTAAQSPTLPPAQKPLTPSFAKFMASKTYGASDATDASILAAQNKAAVDEEREEGALSKTFGWLMGSMNQVENSIMDLTNDELDTSEKIANLGENWAAAGAHWLQPLAEIVGIPGVKTPWEPEALSEFINENNTQYHGTGPISGSRILEERLGLDPKHNVRNAILGFGADVLLDPLTYVGVGLPGKFKKGKDLVEEVVSSSPKGSSPAAFTRPTRPPVRQPSFYQTVAPKVDLAQPKVIRGLNNPMPSRPITITDPVDIKKIRAANLADFRWYEKLHPVVFPEKAVPKNPSFAGYEKIGGDIVKNFPEYPATGARAIPRSEQKLLLNMVASQIGNLSIKTAAQQKYLVKGAEDYLESIGYTFPEGRLSQYMHHSKSTDVDDFVKGVPLKERPLDASMEAKLQEAHKAQGRALLEAKLAKKSPQAFTAAHGINSKVVSDAIDDLADFTDEVIYKIPKATDPVQVKSAVDAAEKIKPGVTNKALTPKQQVSLFESLVKTASDPAVALQMLKVAEEHLAFKYAIKGQHWNGSNLSLSSVVEQLGPDAPVEALTSVLKAFKKGSVNQITDEVAKAAIAKAIAKRSMESGAIAKTILDDYVDTARFLENTISPQKFIEWKQGQAIRRASMAAGAAGLSKSEAARVIDLVKNEINTEGLELLEPMKMLEEVGKRAIASVMNGTAQPDLIARVSRAIQNAVGETPKFQRTDITARSAVDTFLMRMTTWHNRGPMIHTSREEYSFLEDWAKARADWFNNISRSHSPDVILAAFKHAQGHWDNIEIARVQQGIDTPLVSDEVKMLSDKFRDYFENIMVSTRTINDPSKLRGSVAVRAQIMMDDINRQLKATNTTFQFTGKARTTKNIAGNPAGGGLGYGGDHWMLSWENVDPSKLGQDPLHFMYDLSLAVDRVMAEYSLIDDFVMRFGRRVEDADYIPSMTKRVPHHRVAKDVYFEPKTAEDFMNLLKDVEKGNWFPESKFLTQVVKGQRLWKTGVTQYNPSFHVRNFIGDSFLMWLAGHNNPLMFAKARRMIAANRARYKDALANPDLEVLKGFMSKEEYGIMQSKDTTVILGKYGADLTSAEIYGEALQRGLLLDAKRASDIIGEPLFKNVHGRSPSLTRRVLTQPLGGRGHATVMGATEIREHLVRLAHFTSVVNKHMTRAQAKRLRAINANPKIGNKVAARREVLKDVYERASQEVRKWHPDGRDLSYFEQKYFRSVPIPFYSWQRKIIPLLIESAAIRPGKLTVYPKGMFALQNALGIEAPSISDPFPVDQLYPQWMRSLGIGPIGDPESSNPLTSWFGRLGRNSTLGSSDESGYTVINPGNPFNDTVAQFGGTGTSIADSVIKSSSILSPYFNIPKEFLSDTKWTGAPISTEAGGAGYPNWLLSQIPVISNLNRVPNIGANQAENVESQSPDTEALINILTALGIKGSGQYRKSAEFEKKFGIGYSD